MKNRLYYLDALRGFAMLCVVIGHLSLFCYKDSSYSSLSFIVGIFHVNLFMLISGYFVNNENLKITKHVKILIPFFVFGIPYAYLKGYLPWEFLGNETKVGYWFLWSLAIYFVSLYLIKKFRVNLVAGILVVQVIFLLLHFTFHRTAVGMFIGTDHIWKLWSFFCLGIFLRNGWFESILHHKKIVFTLSCVAIVIGGVSGGVFLFDKYWPSILLRWFMAFPICLVLMLAFYQVEQKYKRMIFLGKASLKKVGTSLGTNTLQIYVIHYYLLICLNLDFFGHFMIENHFLILEYVVSPVLALIISYVCIVISNILHKARLGFLFGR